MLGLHRRNLVLCLNTQFVVMAVRGKGAGQEAPRRERRQAGPRASGSWGRRRGWEVTGAVLAPREGGTQVLGLMPHGLDKAL